MLRRERHPIPDDVREALTRRGLAEAYEGRPPYQRNDYLGWITRAKCPETREKRLAHMLDDLAAGDSYMNMKWRVRAS